MGDYDCGGVVNRKEIMRTEGEGWKMNAGVVLYISCFSRGLYVLW